MAQSFIQPLTLILINIIFISFNKENLSTNKTCKPDCSKENNQKNHNIKTQDEIAALEFEEELEELKLADLLCE